ncbi:MAG: DUF1080 domain-containing protein [Balneolaceae bacterium]|nr:DUF1080 domain-containing protein [Balneolaceae bacterium]MBO6546970.1 DUF1080 domain-containing protein [Balneolaceae bacterium]MBO6649330.1 DUF1080 domain-containing protein [Balneolaceae bacterium]
MKKLILAAFSIFLATSLHAQKQVPEATELYVDLEKITPGEGTNAPSDAIVLFDGSDLEKWQSAQRGVGAGSMLDLKTIIPSLSAEGKGSPAPWKVDDNELVVEPGTGFIETRQGFADVQLHIEWLAPAAEGKSGQLYSNSGVFFMGMYEVQILNSYENPTYNNGQASSVYKQHIPLVNASKPVGEWQEYDIVFMAPKFSDKGTLVSPAKVTVFHNGVLVQNNVELLGPTCYIGTPYYVAHESKLPLALQDHGDPMRFRNIWIREL